MLQAAQTKRITATIAACPASVLHVERLNKCDNNILGAMQKLTIRHLGFFPSSAADIKTTIAKLRPFMQAIAELKCQNGDSRCFNMIGHNDLDVINKRLRNSLHRRGFPSAQHKAFMARQRAKMEWNGWKVNA